MSAKNKDAPEDQSGDAKERNQDQTSTVRREPIPPFAMVTVDIWQNPKICKAGPFGTLGYLFALTKNAEHGRKGFFPASAIEPWYLARQLGLSAEEATQAVSRMVEAQLVEIDHVTEVCYVLGWDEKYARRSLTETEARQLRRRKNKPPAASPDSGEKKTKKEKKEHRTQTQKQSSPGNARTVSGQGVWGLGDEDLFPEMTEFEGEMVDAICNAIAHYTGVTSYTIAEGEHVAWLIRGGYDPAELERFAAYICDENGAGWAVRDDKEGRLYMKPHCTPFGIFTEKNMRNQWSAARDWEGPYEYPGSKHWRPRIRVGPSAIDTTATDSKPEYEFPIHPLNADE